MSRDRTGQSPDYRACQYGSSKLMFRGPKPDISGDYIACLGGTETFGKFMPSPYPALISQALDTPCVNLGNAHAGPELYLNDTVVMDIARRAKIVVLEVPSCAVVSNAFYRVHPRRNDRIVEVQRSLRALYPDVDFTEFHFIHHMLETLFRRDALRFIPVLHGLQTAWINSMCRLIESFDGEVMLLWFARIAPPKHQSLGLEHEPLFVSSEMLEDLQVRISCNLQKVIPSRFALEHDGQGMVFDPLSLIAVKGMLGAGAHLEAAEQLLPALNTALIAQT